MKPASLIDLNERDYFLGLSDQAWPHKGLPIFKDPPPPRAVSREQWQAEKWDPVSSPKGRFIGRELHRDIKKDGGVSSFFEAILRFPSAPLFGLQRKRDYQVRLERKHLHTFRLLLREEPSRRPQQIKRLVLMFNGLNEIDHMELYYDVAGLLLEEPDTACLLYPTPGHLTRYPLLGRYAEKPLNRFIDDPGELFRQYLRFMVEMQWLLSTLVPVSVYPVVPGVSLLAYKDHANHSRCDSATLSDEITTAWKDIYEASRELLEEAPPGVRQLGKEVDKEQILSSIETLRWLIGWHPHEKALTELHRDDPIPPPALHLLGYSLGGYFAQSTFFTWPFAVASCTTLCSGGALQDIKLVRFAHEEEWRAVSHGLKYEVESGLLERRIEETRTEKTAEGTKRWICGIHATYFSSYFKIFNEVFLQDPKGSYRPRVSEFAPRLLFVVGGNDPIITTRSVLEASPREGINMIEIANLTHFLPIEKDEEWRGFWLPTISRVLRSFTQHTESLLKQSYLLNLWNSDRTELVSTGRSNDANLDVFKKSRPEPRPLDSESFQQLLETLVKTLEKPSYAFILRNRIPTALLGPRLLYRRGTVPHYEDSRICRYWEGLKRRRELMETHHEKVTLVIPGRLKEWFDKAPPTFSAKSEPFAWEIPSEKSLKEIWSDFLARWEKTEALYCFNPNPEHAPKSTVAKLEELVRKRTHTRGKHPVVNCLPDVWIGLSSEFLDEEISHSRNREAIEKGFVKFVTGIYEIPSSDPDDPLLGRLKTALLEDQLKIVRVSAAELTPRFLGEEVRDVGAAIDLLVHSALALGRSNQCLRAGDFTRLWGPEEGEAGESVLGR